MPCQRHAQPSLGRAMRLSIPCQGTCHALLRAVRRVSVRALCLSLSLSLSLSSGPTGVRTISAGGSAPSAPAIPHDQRRRFRTIRAGFSAVQRRRFRRSAPAFPPARRRGPKSQIDLNLCAVLWCLWRRG